MRERTPVNNTREDVTCTIFKYKSSSIVVADHALNLCIS